MANLRLVYVNHAQLEYERELRKYLRLVEQGHCIGCSSPFVEYVNCDGDPLCSACAIDPEAA